MRKILHVAVLCFFLFSAAACKREHREIACVGQDSSQNLGYLVRAKLSEVPARSCVESVAPRAAGPDGAVVFMKACVACHQVTGKGIPSAFPPLDGASYVLSDDTERLASIMLYGLIGPINVDGTTYNNVMTGFAGLHTDDELAAAATYIRSAWSNKASPVGPEVFAKMRAKWGTRAQFSISELGEIKSN